MWGAIFSSDGLHWTSYPNNPVMPLYLCDECPVGKTLGHITYIQPSGYLPEGFYYTDKDSMPPRFVAFPKLWIKIGKFRRRCIGYSYNEISDSGDFVRWSPPVLILAPDERDDETVEERITEDLEAGVFKENYPEDHRAEFYHMCGFPYEGIYLGFLDVFYAAFEFYRKGGLECHQGGNDEIQMTMSGNLIHWERVGDRKPVISNGQPGDWDRSWKSTVNLPIIVADELLIYYFGSNTDHGGARFPARTNGIGLATLRLDGFVSVDAGRSMGTLTTKPLLVENRMLEVNTQAVRGSVVVEILDETGKAIEGFKSADCDVFSGDSVCHKVTWKDDSDISSLKGRIVKLRFYLENAKLYCFRSIE